MEALTQAQIQAAMLRDQSNRRPGIDTAPDSDYTIRAAGVASAVAGLYAHQSYIGAQIFPNTADHEHLLRHAAIHGLTPKPATSAQGSITVTGSPGTNIPTGTAFKRPDDGINDSITYLTTSPGQIGPDGSATLSTSASTPGNNGNTAPGTPLANTTPVPGLDMAAFVNQMQGGDDPESDPSLLARLLDIIRHPPAGGNARDFKRWAESIPGVAQAFIFPARRGPGTVDIVIIGQSGPPSAATLQAVTDYINSVRPTALRDIRVLAPTVRLIDHTIRIRVASGTAQDYLPLITSAIAKAIAELQPGQPYIKSRIEAIISNLPGVIDRIIDSPLGNIQPITTDTVMEWLQTGSITVTLM